MHHTPADLTDVSVQQHLWWHVCDGAIAVVLQPAVRGGVSCHAKVTNLGSETMRVDG